MSENKSKISAAERMLNLVALLTESSRPLTFEDIVNRMSGQYPEKAEARRTAFEREKKILRKLGVPITMQTLSGADAGKTAYSIDRSEYRLIDFNLTNDELSALQQAAAVVQIGTSWGKKAVHWLGGEVGAGSHSESTRIDAQQPTLPTLWMAVSNRNEVSFVYRGRERVVHPYGLIARNGFWYLIAFDTSRQMQVTFRVDRIESDIALGAENSFTRPSDFDLATAFQRDPKMYPGSENDEAVVRLDPRIAPSVIRELGDDCVQAVRTDGFVDVVVPCGNRTAFKTWLYAMVDRAVVISPDVIRQEIISDLTAMAGGAQ